MRLGRPERSRNFWRRTDTREIRTLTFEITGLGPVTEHLRADMPGYRLFFMGPDGQAELFHAFPSEDDAQARVYAEDERKGRAAELWNGNRIIARFKSDQAAKASSSASD